MKTLFIPVYSKKEIDKKALKELEKLPKNIAICYSIQFKKQAEELKNKLINKKITNFVQVLGCSKPNFSKDTQAILLIGQGKFHSVSLQYETGIPVYLLEENKLIQVSKTDVEKIKQKQKASYVNFLNSKNVGIIISTKPGQQRLKKAIDLKKNLEKKSYLFLSNNINTSEFENFKIDSWVNTACPRLDLDDFRIINPEQLNLSH